MENEVFIDDLSDLNTLIAAGEVEGSIYVDNADINRSSVIRTDFLTAHGVDVIGRSFKSNVGAC